MALYPTLSENIHKGESQLYRINLLQSDGSNLLFSSLLTGTKIEFYQNNSLLATLLLEDDTIREGEATNQLEIEVKSSVSSLFSLGYPVFMRTHLLATNEDFTASSDIQTDIKTYKIGNVL